MSTTVVLYLVSHASGELVEMLARTAVTQLAGVEVRRRLWKMVRRLDQVPEILGVVAATPGYVLHSVSHSDVREALEEGCRHLGVPCHFALEPLVGQLSEYTGAAVLSHHSSGDAFDEDYFRRVEAMKYALAHDDGLASDDLDGADVIIDPVGGPLAEGQLARRADTGVRRPAGCVDVPAAPVRSRFGRGRGRGCGCGGRSGRGRCCGR